MLLILHPHYALVAAVLLVSLKLENQFKREDFVRYHSLKTDK